MLALRRGRVLPAAARPGGQRSPAERCWGREKSRSWGGDPGDKRCSRHLPKIPHQGMPGDGVPAAGSHPALRLSLPWRSAGCSFWHAPSACGLCSARLSAGLSSQPPWYSGNYFSQVAEAVTSPPAKWLGSRGSRAVPWRGRSLSPDKTGSVSSLPAQGAEQIRSGDKQTRCGGVSASLSPRACLSEEVCAFNCSWGTSGGGVGAVPLDLGWFEGSGTRWVCVPQP